jgi:hypothetical protein
MVRIVGLHLKHTDRRAAVLGAMVGALGTGSTLDFMAILRKDGYEDAIAGEAGPRGSRGR